MLFVFLFSYHSLWYMFSDIWLLFIYLFLIPIDSSYFERVSLYDCMYQSCFCNGSLFPVGCIGPNDLVLLYFYCQLSDSLLYSFSHAQIISIFLYSTHHPTS